MVSESVSPNAEKKAVVFVRSCGATTGFSTHVSILDRAAGLTNEPGNVLVVDDNHGAIPIDTNHALGVRASWVADDALVIHYPSASRVFNRLSRFGSVGVSFATTR